MQLTGQLPQLHLAHAARLVLTCIPARISEQSAGQSHTKAGPRQPTPCAAAGRGMRPGPTRSGAAAARAAAGGWQAGACNPAQPRVGGQSAKASALRSQDCGGESEHMQKHMCTPWQAAAWGASLCERWGAASAGWVRFLSHCQPHSAVLVALVLGTSWRLLVGALAVKCFSPLASRSRGAAWCARDLGTRRLDCFLGT